MEFKEINALFKDINKLRSQKIETTVAHKVDGETQGDEGTSFEICPVPNQQLFVRLTIKTDSYGDNETISSIEFVQPIERKVTNYESLK